MKATIFMTAGASLLLAVCSCSRQPVFAPDQATRLLRQQHGWPRLVSTWSTTINNAAVEKLWGEGYLQISTAFRQYPTVRGSNLIERLDRSLEDNASMLHLITHVEDVTILSTTIDPSQQSVAAQYAVERRLIWDPDKIRALGVVKEEDLREIDRLIRYRFLERNRNPQRLSTNQVTFIRIDQGWRLQPEGAPAESSP